MNVRELAKKLEISENTLRTWEKKFNVDVKRGYNNRRRYDDDVVLLFEKIRELKDENRGLNTIRKVIGNDNLQTTTNNLHADTNNLHTATNELQNNLNSVTNNFQEIIRKEISEHTELAEKYAKATYKIGELETTNKFLVKENEKLEEKIKLLPEPNEIQNLKKELEKTKKEFQEYKQPWWKKLFKKS